MPYGPVGVHHRGGAQVDVGRGQPLDERAQRVGSRETWDLVPELEVVEDVLHVRGESVEVRLEVGPELLAACPGSQITQREPRGVVEGLTGCVPQGLVLSDDACRVERSLHVEDRLLGVFQHGIEPAQHRHREDDIAILAADIQVAQHVIGDPPDVARDPPDVPVRSCHVSGFRSLDFGVRGASLGQSIPRRPSWRCDRRRCRSRE